MVRPWGWFERILYLVLQLLPRKERRGLRKECRYLAEIILSCSNSLRGMREKLFKRFHSYYHATNAEAFAKSAETSEIIILTTRADFR